MKAINLSANYVYDSFFKGNIEGYEGYSTYNNGSTTFYYHTNSNYNLRQSGSVNEWKSATDKGAIIVNSAGNDGIDFAAEPGMETLQVSQTEQDIFVKTSSTQTVQFQVVQTHIRPNSFIL